MDPAVVMEASKVAAEEFRRDYLVASVVVLLVVNGAWALGVRSLIRALASAQEARVFDQKEDKAELAAHLDKASTAVEMFLDDARRRAKVRRSTDPKP